MPRKIVSIRGLDTELYHEVFSMAKKDGKRVSEVVNKALSAFLNGDHSDERENSNVSKGVGMFTLKNDGEISLSKNDIINLKKEVGLFRIETTGRLKFDKDLDKDSLKNIDKIVVHDGTVEVPRDIYPHLLLKSEIFGKIEKY